VWPMGKAQTSRQVRSHSTGFRHGEGESRDRGNPKLTTLEVKPLGPSAAHEIGTFSLKTKGSTPQEVTGKYLVVWEKVGSDWKLAADIWNDGK
jgi:ketosteroid isomerase-like protein